MTSVFCNSNLLTQISSLCFDDNGFLYASNFGNGGIVKIDQSGNATLLTDLGTSSNYISCITHYDDYLYVSVFAGTGNIYKVSVSDGSYSILTTIPGIDISTIGIVYYQNHVYVVVIGSNYEFKGVYKIDIVNGATSLFISPSVYNFSTSIGYISIDTNGNFYITDGYNNIIKFDNSGALISTNFIIPTYYCSNILFYQNHFYVINYNNNVIDKYDINGTLITPSYATGGTTYLGGGMVFDSSGNFYVSNEANGNVTINRLINSIPCFHEDTKILTNCGYRPIKELQKDDLIKTLKHGYKPIDMIGKRKIYNLAINDRIKDQIYKCTNDNYPEIFEDLLITGCHSILVDDFTNEEQKNMTIEINKKIFVTDGKYRLPACVDLRSSIYETPGMYTIYHLALENDDQRMNYGIYANGLLVETCSKRYLKELSNMTLV